MCFSCKQVEVAVAEGRSVVYERGYDAYTLPSDFDLADEAVEGFRRGDWGYVSLTASVVGADGSLLGSYCLYGIAEWSGSPCALGDVGAVEWVTGQAFERAEAAVLAQGVV